MRFVAIKTVEQQALLSLHRARISDRYVSRVIRLAWLSPLMLERLVLRREPTVLWIFDLCGVVELPWVEQPERVFG
jgi:hypothetical protein